MELKEAILGRRSVRSFLPDPVPHETITKLVEAARWAPSWGNTQPWEIVVADGGKARELGKAFIEEVKNRQAPRPDVPMPLDFPEPHKIRYKDVGKGLFKAMGIQRDDKEARQRHYLNMYQFFGAPACIYLTVDGGLNVPYACLDIGSIGTTICYMAFQEGLGTIFLAASVHYPDIIRKVLSLPEHKKVVIGIAIGTPNTTDTAGAFRSDRESVTNIIRFA